MSIEKFLNSMRIKFHYHKKDSQKSSFKCIQMCALVSFKSCDILLDPIWNKHNPTNDSLFSFYFIEHYNLEAPTCLFTYFCKTLLFFYRKRTFFLTDILGKFYSIESYFILKFYFDIYIYIYITRSGFEET